MPVERMMNLYKYNDEILRKVIPDMRKALPDGGGKLQYQLVLCVSSEKMKKIFRKQNEMY